MSKNGADLVMKVEEQYHELLGIAIQGFMDDTGRAPTIDEMENALHCSLPHLSKDSVDLQVWWYVSELLHCMELFRSVRGSDIDAFEPILGEVFENIIKITGQEPADDLIESLMSFGLDELSEEDEDVFEGARSDRSESIDSIDQRDSFQGESDDEENQDAADESDKSFSFQKVSISGSDLQRERDVMWERIGKKLAENLLEAGVRIYSPKDAASKTCPQLIDYLGDLFDMKASVTIDVFLQVLESRAGINNHTMPKEVYTLITWLDEEFASGNINVGRFGDAICSKYNFSSEVYQVSAREDSLDFCLSGKWIEKRKRASQRVRNPDAERIMWNRMLSRIKKTQKQLGNDDLYASDFVRPVFEGALSMTASEFFVKLDSLGIDFNSMGTDVHVLVALLGGEDGMDTEQVVSTDLFCRTLEQREKESREKHSEESSYTAERSEAKEDHSYEGVDEGGKTSGEPHPRLLEGWQEATDPDSGDTYYYNSTTGEESWTRPTWGHASPSPPSPEDDEAKMWAKLGSLVAEAMRKTGQLGLRPEEFMKSLFLSDQVGRADFLVGLNSIGFNRQSVGKRHEIILDLTGFSDPTSPNIIDVSVLVQLTAQHFDFSVLQSFVTNNAFNADGNSSLSNFDFRVRPGEQQAAEAVAREKMWMETRRALSRAIVSNGSEESLDGYVTRMFGGVDVVTSEVFTMTLSKMGLSEAELGADWRVLLKAVHQGAGGVVSVSEFIKGFNPDALPEEMDQLQLDRLQKLESGKSGTEVDANQGIHLQIDVNSPQSTSSTSSSPSFSKKLAELDVRMIKRVGAQFICAMKPRPGERYHNGLEDFLLDQVFAKQTSLPIDAFLASMREFGVTPEYLGSDWDLLVNVLDRSGGSRAVRVDEFIQVLLFNFDSQHGIRSYEESVKVMHDRFSACLVSHVPSIKKLDFSSPTEQMAEIARVLREALYVEEISGSVGAIKVDAFLKRMKTVGVHQDTMGYCMDTVLALVDPRGTGKMDIDLFVEDVVAHFDSMAWFSEWEPEAPDMNAAIRPGAANSGKDFQREVSSFHALRSESSSESKSNSNSPPPEQQPHANLSVEAKASLARRLSRCLIECLIKQTKGYNDGDIHLSRPTQEEILPMIWKSFSSFDADDTGLIDLDEFVLVMESLGIDQSSMGASMETLIDLVDEDGDGLIDYDEFMQFIMTYFDKSAWLIFDETTGEMMGSDMISKRDMVQRISQQVAARVDPSTINPEDGRLPADILTLHLEEVFSSIDVDNSGSLDAKEFWKALQTFDKESVRLDPTVMSAIDKDNSGSIDYREFVAFMAEYFDNSVLNMFQHIQPLDTRAQLLPQALPPQPRPQQPSSHHERSTLPATKSAASDALMESLGEFQDQELKALLELERSLGVVTHDPVAKGNAAIKLQAQIRRRQATNRAKRLVAEKETSAAAVRIQAHLRGAQAREMYHHRLAVQNQAAATKLQAGFRGFKARSRARAQRQETSLAATKLQAGFRGHKARNKAKSVRKESNRAATKLQAGFRGHVARRRAKKERAETASAATKLQAGFRGHAARRRAKKERAETASAATKLQAGFRGHRARKAVKKEITTGELTNHSHAPELDVPTNTVASSTEDYPQTASILSPARDEVLSPDRESSQCEDSVFGDDRYRRNVTEADRRTDGAMYGTPYSDYAGPHHGINSKKKKIRKKKRGKRRKTTSKSAGVNGRKRSRKRQSPSAANGPPTMFPRRTAPKSPTNTSGVTSGSFGPKSRASPRSLHMSLASGQSLQSVNTFASPQQQLQQQQQSLTSLYAPVIDWGDVRLIKLNVSRDAHSLESLYRPLAIPHLLPEAFESLIGKIRMLWRQLCFPAAQRRPLMSRIQVVNKENYTLLVSHMMLLQSAHTQLVGIINKIRHELGEDPVGVGTGAHVSPSAVGSKARLSINRAKRPAGSMPPALVRSPRRAKARSGHGRRSQRTDQWATELAIAIAQFKAVTPWLQEFTYKGVCYG